MAREQGEGGNRGRADAFNGRQGMMKVSGWLWRWEEGCNDNLWGRGANRGAR